MNVLSRYLAGGRGGASSGGSKSSYSGGSKGTYSGGSTGSYNGGGGVYSGGGSYYGGSTGGYSGSSPDNWNGGTYSGSGGYYGGNGGYYSSGNTTDGSSSSYDSSRNTSSGSDASVAMILIVVAILMVVFGFVCYLHKKMKSVGGTSSGSVGVAPKSDAAFDRAVDKARKSVSSTSNSIEFSGGGVVTFQNFGGDFEITYSDRGKILSGSGKVQLQNTGLNGYKISGKIADADGEAIITDGFVNYSGAAWWLQTTFSGEDRGLKVLSEGKFDFSNNSFAGSWRANTDVQGKYTLFKGKNVVVEHKPVESILFSVPMGGDTIPTADPMLEESNMREPSVVTPSAPPHDEEEIPVAMAVAEIPIVSAVIEKPSLINANEPEVYVPKV